MRKEMREKDGDRFPDEAWLEIQRTFALPCSSWLSRVGSEQRGRYAIQRTARVFADCLLREFAHVREAFIERID